MKKFSILLLWALLIAPTNYKAINLEKSQSGLTVQKGYVTFWNNNAWLKVSNLNRTIQSVSIKARNHSKNTFLFPLIGFGQTTNTIRDSLYVSRNFWKWYSIDLQAFYTDLYITFMNDYVDKITDADVNVDIDSIKIIFSDSTTSGYVRVDTLKGKSLIISWQANKEKDLAGYKLYWGNAARDYRFVRNVGLDTVTYAKPAYHKRWDFAVTAFDTAGNESQYSQDKAVYFLPPDTLAPPDTIPPAKVLRLKVTGMDSVIIIIK